MVESLKNLERLFKKSEVSSENSTIGADILNGKELNVDTSFFNAIEFSIWDFAGEPEYSTIHQVCTKSNQIIYFQYFRL